MGRLKRIREAVAAERRLAPLRDRSSVLRLFDSDAWNGANVENPRRRFTGSMHDWHHTLTEETLLGWTRWDGVITVAPRPDEDPPYPAPLGKRWKPTRQWRRRSSCDADKCPECARVRREVAKATRRLAAAGERRRGEDWVLPAHFNRARLASRLATLVGEPERDDGLNYNDEAGSPRLRRTLTFHLAAAVRAAVEHELQGVERLRLGEAVEALAKVRPCSQQHKWSPGEETYWWCRGLRWELVDDDPPPARPEELVRLAKSTGSMPGGFLPRPRAAQFMIRKLPFGGYQSGWPWLARGEEWVAPRKPYEFSRVARPEAQPGDRLVLTCRRPDGQTSPVMAFAANATNAQQVLAAAAARARVTACQTPAWWVAEDWRARYERAALRLDTHAARFEQQGTVRPDCAHRQGDERPADCPGCVPPLPPRLTAEQAEMRAPELAHANSGGSYNGLGPWWNPCEQPATRPREELPESPEERERWLAQRTPFVAGPTMADAQRWEDRKRREALALSR